MSEAARRVRSALRKWERRTITVGRLQTMAEESDYLRFHRLVTELQKEGLISPVRASGHNGRSPSLYNRYRLVREEEPEPAYLEEISALPFDRAVQHYRNHPEQYQDDRHYVRAICQFLLSDGDSSPVTVNERSYQLFRDEKALKDGRAGTVLERMGLTFEDLRVIRTAEPFAHFDVRHLGGGNEVLIVENLDSFISVHRCLREGLPLLGELLPGFIVYGEGNKILSSFRFAREVPGLGEEARYLYFGDIDYEGISIYRRLVRRYEGFSIEPWLSGYLGLLQVEPDPPVSRGGQRRGPMGCFLGHFPPRGARRIEELLVEGKYIPQEALSLAHFKGEIRL